MCPALIKYLLTFDPSQAVRTENDKHDETTAHHWSANNNWHNFRILHETAAPSLSSCHLVRGHISRFNYCKLVSLGCFLLRGFVSTGSPKFQKNAPGNKKQTPKLEAICLQLLASSYSRALHDCFGAFARRGFSVPVNLVQRKADLKNALW